MEWNDHGLSKVERIWDLQNTPGNFFNIVLMFLGTVSVTSSILDETMKKCDQSTCPFLNECFMPVAGMLCTETFLVVSLSLSHFPFTPT